MFLFTIINFSSNCTVKEGLIYLTSLLCSTTCIYSQSKIESTFLSDKDPGYDYIEKKQKELCELRPNLNCELSNDACVDTILSLYRRNGFPRPQDTTILKHCGRISTRYEVQGSYTLFQDYYNAIEKAAAALGYSLHPKPAIGTLAIKEINASSREIGFSVILFNFDFVTYSTEMLKLTSATLPLKRSDTNRVSSLNETLDRRPELTYQFAERIAAFHEGNTRRSQLSGRRDVLDVISLYLQGIDLFALAHEYSHLLLGHTKDFSRSFKEQLAGPCHTQEVGDDPHSWVDEIEADLLAAKILSTIIEGVPIEQRAFSVLAGPEFYFSTLKVFEEGQQIMCRQNKGKQPQDLKYLTEVLKCAELNTINLQKQLLEVAKKNKIKGYPSLELRKKIAESLLTRQVQQSPAQYNLFTMMDANLFDIWKRGKIHLKNAVNENHKNR